MKSLKRRWLAMLLGLLALWCELVAQSVMAQTPIFRAVLFYSPTCGHCHHVINEVLPPLFEQYGDQLHIVGINVADQEGYDLYQSAIDHFDIPGERRGVPTLVVGDIVLVGSHEIPAQLPVLIEQSLAESGVDWPEIPGLVEILSAVEAEANPESTADASTAATPTSTPSPLSRANSNLVEPKRGTMTPLATVCQVHSLCTVPG